MTSAMAMMYREEPGSRIKSAVGVAAIHGLFGYALIHGLGFQVVRGEDEILKVFDVSREPPPPPPVEEKPPAVRTDAAEGAASPPNIRSKPSPVAAPPPKVVLKVPPPVVAAPDPAAGSDRSAGAAEVAGPGTGAGGEGTGTGSGRAGSGTGGGGIATRPQYLEGRIVNADFPRALERKKGAARTVLAHFTVRADGRVSGCKVVKSSGDGELDAATCRLIEARFRYAPARDRQGQAVADVMGWKQVWWI